MSEYKLCNENDIENNTMKEFEINLEGDVEKKYKVLLVKSNNKLHCLPTKCAHYNVPLVNGVLYKGRIRCLAHGAAFNVSTGDIEDYPGPDCLPKYNINVDKSGAIYLKITKEELETTKRIRQTQNHIDNLIVKNHPKCLIIGSGPAGTICLDTLREAGYFSNITMLTKESFPPYDRPKLTKSPDITIDKITIRDLEYFEKNKINFHMNQEVERIDFNTQTVFCKNNRTFSYERLVVATGLRANAKSSSNIQGVFTIRSLEDTHNIIKYFEQLKNLSDKTNRLNVIVTGGSFIAMEIVCYFVDKANSTVMSRNKPYQSIFGNLVSEKIQLLHETKGVKFYINKTFDIVEFIESKERPGCLGSVKLQDDSCWPVDLCIQAIGGTPCTDFLKNTPVKLTLDNYVYVDKNMQTNVKNVYAVGDIAQFPRECISGIDFTLSKHSQKLDHTNIAHFGVASSHGRCAALSIINSTNKNADKNQKDIQNALRIVPFFWSTQHGKNLRFAGYNHKYDIILFHEDKTRQNEFKFAAFYLRSNVVVAVCSLDWDPVCALFAEAMHNQIQVKREHIEKNPLNIKNLLIS